MSFIQQLIIVVADKLMIGIAIVVVGYIFNKRLKVMENKQMLDLQVAAQIAAARLPAYKALWEYQETSSPTLDSDLTVQQRKELEDKLRKWYYKDGNGIFLSHEAATSYLKARDCLKKEGAKFEDIRADFSSLRTQMKEDMRIYNSEEGKAPTVSADSPFGGLCA
ncbi:MAG TPA: hypothetical protein VGO56_19390 [Pyrinomonadaceae bacterium]|jgi:hypothetical protein|nr:hypothetical protein [Pyrinomonadaceae bacterium]